VYKILVRKPEVNRTLGGPSHRWEENIKMSLKDIGYEDVWIGLIWHRIVSSGKLLCMELVVCGLNSCMEHVFQGSIPKFH
jgi:hypothetical protein